MTLTEYTNLDPTEKLRSLLEGPKVKVECEYPLPEWSIELKMKHAEHYMYMMEKWRDADVSDEIKEYEIEKWRQCLIGITMPKMTIIE